MEPFCYRPWEIARLTDWQIIHGLILPAVARNEAMERERKGLPQPVDELDERNDPDWEPDKAQMLSVMVGMLGMTKEQALAEYEAQKKMNAEAKKSR